MRAGVLKMMRNLYGYLLLVPEFNLIIRLCYRLTVKPVFIWWYFVSCSTFTLISVSIFAVTRSCFSQQYELSTNIYRRRSVSRVKPSLNDLSLFVPVFRRVNDFHMTIRLCKSSKSRPIRLKVANFTKLDHLESISVVTSNSILCWLGGFGRIPNGSVGFFG